MSLAQITDVQLGRLLSQVPEPLGAAVDLADRIVARSVRTPQVRARLLPIPRRHGARRRPAIWSVVIAANLMAAAAAATAWDGRQFNFHRLVDLPHHVIAAIRVGHHPKIPHEVLQREHAHRVRPQVATLAPHSVPPIERSGNRRDPIPVATVPIVPALGQAISHVRVTARGAKKLHSSAAMGRPFGRVQPVLDRHGSFHHLSIGRSEPVGAEARSAEPREAEIPRPVPRLSKRFQWHPRLEQHRQMTAETDTYPKIPEHVSQAPPPAQVADMQQPKWEPDRERRWQRSFFKRIHPRQRGGRFRRRF